MAIVLPTAAVCLLVVLGFVYWKFIRTPMKLDEDEALTSEVGGGEAGHEVAEEPRPVEEEVEGAD